MTKMRKIQLFLVCASLSFSSGADRWRLVRNTEFLSGNREFRLTVEPDEDWQLKPGHCHATLYRGKEKLWSRYLVNDANPVRVYVSDSGRYIVTMDDWGRLGDIPIVVYGRSGSLVRVHSLSSLGIKREDQARMTGSRSGYHWNEHSINFFCHDSRVFYIRLKINKTILIDLRSGYAHGEDESNTYGIDRIGREEWGRIAKESRTKARKMALLFLKSEDKDERITGAVICGQEKIEESVPLLRKLLDDEAFEKRQYTEKIVQVFSVRKAAVEALKSMGMDVESVTTTKEIPVPLPNR